MAVGSGVGYSLKDRINAMQHHESEYHASQEPELRAESSSSSPQLFHRSRHNKSIIHDRVKEEQVQGLKNEKMSQVKKSPQNLRPQRSNKWKDFLENNLDTINYYGEKAEEAIIDLAKTVNYYGDKTAQMFSDIERQPLLPKLKTTAELVYLGVGGELIELGAVGVLPGVRWGAEKLGSNVSRIGKFWQGRRGEGILNTGGRQLESIKLWDKAEKQATQFYKKIRGNPSNADVRLISENSGMPEFQVQRIKQHLFFDSHKLTAGIGRFSPDIEIADAWTRLQSGNSVKQDFRLLQHEYFEARFKDIFKTDYIIAHNAANSSGRIWKPEEFFTTPEMSWRP